MHFRMNQNVSEFLHFELKVNDETEQTFSHDRPFPSFWLCLHALCYYNQVSFDPILEGCSLPMADITGV